VKGKISGNLAAIQVLGRAISFTSEAKNDGVSFPTASHLPHQQERRNNATPPLLAIYGRRAMLLSKRLHAERTLNVQRPRELGNESTISTWIIITKISRYLQTRFDGTAHSHIQ